MSKKSERTIKRNLGQLRNLIDTTEDPVLKRVAYSMENAVRWATENTVGWPGLVQQAVSEAYMLKQENKENQK